MPELTGDPNAQDPAWFIQDLRGSCLCGSVEVVIHDTELFTKRRGHICHCVNCRKVSGSYAASNFVLEEEKVEIADHEGTLTKFVDTQTGSGQSLDRYFCSRCGSPIKSVTPLYKGKIVLKMGIFPRIPAPEFETFALHRHDWQGIHPEMTQYEVNAFGEKFEMT